MQPAGYRPAHLARRAHSPPPRLHRQTQTPPLRPAHETLPGTRAGPRAAPTTPRAPPSCRPSFLPRPSYRSGTPRPTAAERCWQVQRPRSPEARAQHLALPVHRPPRRGYTPALPPNLYPTRSFSLTHTLGRGPAFFPGMAHTSTQATPAGLPEAARQLLPTWAPRAPASRCQEPPAPGLLGGQGGARRGKDASGVQRSYIKLRHSRTGSGGYCRDLPTLVPFLPEQGGRPTGAGRRRQGGAARQAGRGGTAAARGRETRGHPWRLCHGRKACHAMEESHAMWLPWKKGSKKESGCQRLTHVSLPKGMGRRRHAGALCSSSVGGAGGCTHKRQLSSHPRQGPHGMHAAALRGVQPGRNALTDAGCPAARRRAWGEREECGGGAAGGCRRAARQRRAATDQPRRRFKQAGVVAGLAHWPWG